MKETHKFVFSFHSLIILAILACAIPGLGEGPPTPPPSPTPPGDTLYFNAPYVANLTPGVTVPGTLITYVGPSGDRFQMTIDGLPAVKASGDSLPWVGVIARGVHGNYQLHLRANLLGQLTAEGSVRLAIFNPNPVQLPAGQSPVGVKAHFTEIPINYVVPQGATIPGTSLVFEGQENQFARLSGTANYPYYAQNDSLVWLGNLQDNVSLSYDLRVQSLNEYGLGLTGKAELWIND